MQEQAVRDASNHSGKSFEGWKVALKAGNALKGHGFGRAESDFQNRALAPGLRWDSASKRAAQGKK
jgi:hypothetical protein